jgi:hypothetical protein
MNANLPFFQVNPVDEADPLSRAVVRLTMEFQADHNDAEAKPLATGSGIIVRPPNAGYFLATAWHNLSGRDPESMKPKRPDCALPNWVRIHGFYFNHRAPLRDGDNQPGAASHARYWTFRRPPAGVHQMSPAQCVEQSARADVALLPLEGVAQCHCQFAIALGGVGPPVKVTDQVYVVGFPLGLESSQSQRSTSNLEDRQRGERSRASVCGNAEVFDRCDDYSRHVRCPGDREARAAVGQIIHQFLGLYTGRYAVPKIGNAAGLDVFGNEPRTESSALGWVTKPEVIQAILQDGPFLSTEL